MVGKLDPDDLARVFGRLGAPDDAVACGPAYGEDAAAIDLGERTLVASTDPISLAGERVGTLGVHVACNDVAAAGADPAWLLSTVLVPEGDDGAPDDAVLDAVTEQLDAAARDVGVAVVGGHTEYSAELSRPLLSLTCLGLADRFVPTAGATPGDRVLLTGGAGLEGTAILATDFRADLAGEVSEAVLDRAAGFFDSVGVVPAAAAVRECATAMHDPTEGGVLGGLFEVASAAGVGVEVDREAVPVRAETAAVCSAVGVDPLRIFGSGALVATVPGGEVDAALGALAAAGVEAAAVGRVVDDEEPTLWLDGDAIRDPVRDDLYALWE